MAIDALSSHRGSRTQQCVQSALDFRTLFIAFKDGICAVSLDVATTILKVTLQTIQGKTILPIDTTGEIFIHFSHHQQ